MDTELDVNTIFNQEHVKVLVDKQHAIDEVNKQIKVSLENAEEIFRNTLNEVIDKIAVFNKTYHETAFQKEFAILEHNSLFSARSLILRDTKKEIELKIDFSPEAVKDMIINSSIRNKQLVRDARDVLLYPNKYIEQDMRDILFKGITTVFEMLMFKQKNLRQIIESNKKDTLSKVQNQAQVISEHVRAAYLERDAQEQNIKETLDRVLEGYDYAISKKKQYESIDFFKTQVDELPGENGTINLYTRYEKKEVTKGKFSTYKLINIGNIDVRDFFKLVFIPKANEYIINKDFKEKVVKQATVKLTRMELKSSAKYDKYLIGKIVSDFIIFETLNNISSSQEFNKY